MNKKIILIGSGLLGVLSFLVLYHTSHFFTTYLEWGTLIFTVIFLFSIITYFLHESTFLAWRKFTLWWVILSALYILITPEWGFRGLGGLGPITFISFITKEIAAFFSAGGYAFFATLLVLYKSWKLRK